MCHDHLQSGLGECNDHLQSGLRECQQCHGHLQSGLGECNDHLQYGLGEYQHGHDQYQHHIYIPLEHQEYHKHFSWPVVRCGYDLTSSLTTGIFLHCLRKCSQRLSLTSLGLASWHLTARPLIGFSWHHVTEYSA